MIIDELNKKIADIESLANDKTSTIESKVSDLTDGLLMVADAVDIIPEMVDEKITAITKEFSTIKDAVSKVKAQKGEKGAKGDKGDKGDTGATGADGKDGSPDTPEQIAEKLNELEGVLDTKVLKDFSMPDVKDLERQINTIGNQTLRLLSRPTSTGGTGTTTTINGLSGDVTFSEGNNITLNTSGNDIEITANFTQEGKYMISGGITWSGTGLTYDVSFLNYFFNGNKTANPTQVTLAASDPTNNRFDAIVVDEAGTVTAITGTASANPEVPAIPEDQLQVTIILVAAGSTTPTIASEEIYMDDPTTDWTFSTYTTGTPTGSINFAGTSSPKQGTECIEASTDARLGARFVRDTSFDAFQYTMLQVWVRFTGTAVATNKSLNVRFENSAGALVANTVNLFSYGLQRGVLNTWQLVVVPITAFGALPATVKGLKMIMGGGTVGVVRQWDIDYMILTNGSVPYANVPTIAFSKNGTGIASQSGLNLIEGTGVTITGVNNPLYNRVDYTINASGGSSPITVGTSGNTLYSSALIDTGQGDTSIGHNIFLGDYAGGTSNSVSYSNLFGFGAGYGISGSIQNMNAFGRQAGLQANNSANSNFFGVFAGSQSTNSFSSNFIGADAGNNADQSFGANFIGAGAGAQSKNSAFSNFIGFQAGNNIISSYANDSIFIGTGAGANDSPSNYGEIYYSSLSGTFTVGEVINSSSGGSAYIMFDNGSDLRIANVQGVFNINDTITGDDSGATANLDYFDTSKASILIGNNTSTGGFSNSIGLGAGATNTATNELMIGSASSPINTMVVKGTGGIQVPVGTTAERSATPGTIRYNTDTSKFEGYDGSTWVDLN